MRTTPIQVSKPDTPDGRQPDIRRWALTALGLVAAITLVGCSGDVQGDGRAEGTPAPTAAEPDATAQAPSPAGEDPGWTAPTPGPAVETLTHVHGVQMPGWADGAVFVSTHQGAFLIDNEGAWSWISEQPHDFMGFAAHPTDPAVLYSSGHPAEGSDLANPIGFMVSTDAGATWEPRSLQGEVDFHLMAVHPRDGDVIYGYDGRRGLLRTTDAGRTWDSLAAPALEQAGLASLAVGTDDGELYAGTEAGLLHSTDAGGSWEPLLEAPVTAIHVDAGDRQRLVAYAPDGDLGLVASEDDGATWAPLGLVLDGDAAGHVAVDPTDAATIWVGTFGQSLWRTTDGGDNWEQLVAGGARTDG